MNVYRFHRDEFLTLREEIKASRSRLFWIVTMGLFGVPVLSYLAYDAARLVWLLVPYSVLLLIVMFVLEQSNMMRAGRYIRERVEQGVFKVEGWEAWLESSMRTRLIEKQFVACFVVIFFVYYVITIAMAVQRLLDHAEADPSGQYWYWLSGAAVTYAIGAVWALATLVHHWRDTVSTRDEAVA
ncbi:MAG TPA: hypothetical protein P5572_02570 [Phycisphaerae bacterium]|nr:hypothetical protein [Phycisphaerales bacterium]HRX83884.1 hypothetical protein [Phycisphaerae bacterium]